MTNAPPVLDERKPTLKDLLERIDALHREVEDLEKYCGVYFTHYYGIMTLHRLMLEDLELHIKKCPIRGT